MIEIDGSFGYGQVLRTSIALSSLASKPIRIFNIRKGRSRPGLMPQHLAGVKIAGEFSNAKIRGLAIGSTEIEFIPNELNISDKKIDIGTAGQIPLLLQTLFPLLLKADEETDLEITGGTSGLGSPSMQFLQFVTFPILSRFGISVPQVEIVKEGFYPRGGGKVKIRTFPAKKINAVQIMERGKIKIIKGVSVVGSLPNHVSERQSTGAIQTLKKHGFDLDLESKNVNTLSPGTSITLWAECENSILGSDEIGKKGLRAEVVGENCAKNLIKSIESISALDKWTADQVLIFLSLAHGSSEIKVEEITEHCRTNMKVINEILGIEFEVDEESRTIKVKGIGNV